MQVTLSCLRALLDQFFVMYRLLHWERQVQERRNVDFGFLQEKQQGLGLEERGDSVIFKHHVASSTDVFYKISMYYDLHPAARLSYRHTFSGLYNCISQPVYYHNPEYQRRAPPTLERARACNVDLDTLPSLLQLFPEIVVMYDDEIPVMHCPVQTKQQQKGSVSCISLHGAFQKQQKQRTPAAAAAGAGTQREVWKWLVTPGKIYLARLFSFSKYVAMEVFAEEDGNLLRCLRKHYNHHQAAHG